MPASQESQPAPSSILIIGSGVFGLSTAYALAQRPAYRNTKITLLDRTEFPAPDGSSIDSSRIIRADYADAAYTSLMAEAHPFWRGELGAEGRYTQSGLAIFAENASDDSEATHFLEKSLANVVGTLGLRRGTREEGGEVEVFQDEAGVKKIMGTSGGDMGTKGYVNWTSGWAHAEEGMKFVRKQCAATGRVEFRTAEVQRLIFVEDDRGSRVQGAQLSTGENVTADLTILATGAWTPKFIDLRGRASATGQVLAYLAISQEEQDQLSSNPVFISEASGMFIIPPVDRVLKVARHGFGYANFQKIPNPENPNESITVSLPRTKQDDPNLEIPEEGRATCRAFLRKCIPALAERPWTHTRICWYTDTPKGDWIIDFHPRYAGLIVATGGSGHGYKFLPVIGDRVVDMIEGLERDELGRVLRQKWKWPEQRLKEDHVWTKDWRGGEKGMILGEGVAK